MGYLLINSMKFTVFSKSEWKWQVTTVLSILITSQVDSQEFIFDCNDPQLLINHMDRTYCNHACGLAALGLPDMSQCRPDGLCICNYPCDFPAFVQSDICPIATDPPFPDPTIDINALCLQSCQTICAGAGALVCGNNIVQGPTGMTFSKICTCHCPPSPCPVTTPSPIAVTTTPAPTTVNLLPNILGIIASSAILKGLKGKLAKLFATKIFTLGGVLFKVSGLYFLKCALIILYYFALHSWFDYHSSELFGLMGSGFDNSLFGRELSNVTGINGIRRKSH